MFVFYHLQKDALAFIFGLVKALDKILVDYLVLNLLI